MTQEKIEEVIDTINHVLDAYEVGDIDPLGSVERLKKARAYLAVVARWDHPAKVTVT